MSQTTVSQLPAETVKLITSTQIVTSVSTAVKELLENSIDAGAKSIQVRLENYGLDTIEVKDDGTGVSYDNVQRMFLPGYTSKIRQFEDLDKLYFYGFRGEALAAICKIGKVTMTTKTALDGLAMTYEIDSTGLPLSSKPSHLNKGTVITVVNLFSNLPVRRLYLSSKKKMSEELKKTEQVVQSLSMIHPELGVSLVHNKCPIWKKNSVKGLKQSFMQVVSLKTASKMDLINKSTNEVNIDLIVPKKNLDNLENIFTNSQQNVYVYVNKRPINCKNLQQPVQEHIFHHFSSLNPTFKYAVSLISINMSPQQMDINLEPNKTKVLLKNRIEVIKLIDDALSNYYGHDFSCTVLKELNQDEEVVSNEECSDHQSKRPRLESESLSESVGDKRTRLFKEKNKEWHLEIINEDSPVGSKLNLRNILGDGSESTLNESSQTPSLCSQINKDNCILTTEKEVSELNAILNETNSRLVTCTNSINSETRLVDRNDIQSKKVDKILPDWPCRPKVVIESQPVETKSQDSEPTILESTPPVESKTVEEIVAEIENDAKKWSSEMMKSTENEVEERSLEGDVKGFDLSMQSVSSQMGKKEMKAFTKFARIMRPKIVQEFPNLMFTQVAGLLADRWKALTPDEVKYYEKMAEVVDLNRRTYQEEKEKEKPITTKPSFSKKATVKSIFERIKKKNKIQRPPRKEVSFNTSISDVKTLRNCPRNEIIDDDFHIIGQLQPSGNWLYRKDKEIGHVRHQGLQELIIYQKMISSHSIPRKSLDRPIPVTEGNVGTVLWNVLISLDCEYDSSWSKYVIASDVIAKNGFLIEIDKSSDVVTSVNILEVASSIPQFGIGELKEVLAMYQKNGEFGGLASCRPTSVCNYLTNEAVRLTQISWASRTPDREEMDDMMNTYHLCLRHLPPICLHSKEIFPSIHHLEMEFTDSPSQTENQFQNETLKIIS